ncbi:MAG: transporter [Nitrococcus mobilis]|nr:transporter [Nitrococcus mobilis]
MTLLEIMEYTFTLRRMGGCLCAAVFCSAVAAVEPASGKPEPNFLGVRKVPLEKPITTDRPSFGNAAVTVPSGHFLLESGYRYGRDGDDSVHNGPVLLLRSGLTRNLELRIGWDGYVHGGNDRRGFGNTRIGLKVQALREQALTPSLVVIPELVLPTGDEDVVADEVEPMVRMAWGHTLTPSTAISGNFNVAARADANSNRHRLVYAASLAAGFALSARISGYIEYFGIFRESGLGRDSHSIDSGLAYLVSNRLQVDAFVGAGLNKAAEDVFAGAGIAHLW